MNYFVKHRLPIVIIAIFFIVNGLLTLVFLESTKREIQAEKHAVTTLLTIERIHKTVLSAETGQRGYILTKDKEYLEPFSLALTKMDALLKRLDAQVQERDQLYAMTQILKKQIKMKVSELKQTVNLVKDDNKVAALSIVNSDIGLNLMQDIAETMSTMKEEGLIQIENSNYQSNRNVLFSSLMVLMTNIIGFGLMIFYSRNIKQSAQRENELNQSLIDANATLEKNVDARTIELTEKTAELERSNEELENFAYVASHDLQEPLRKIRAFGDRLIQKYEDQLDDTGKDYLNRMKNASERMSHLIEDMLAFSRVSTKQLDFVPISLADILDDVQRDFQHQIDDIGGHVESESLPSVMGDFSQLSQVITNVFSNAIKYRSEQRPLTLSISVNEVSSNGLGEIIEEPVSDHFYEILFKDNGIGFDASLGEKIFVMFQRLHGRSAYKGTGIGLAICKKIIERHNGAMCVDSAEAGQGATFAIYLPKYKS